MNKQDKMQKLALESNLTFDGHDDTVLHYDEDKIYFYACDMTKQQYKFLQSEVMESVIDKPSYTVYAWSDESGFEYWTKSGESNYIQISVDIKDVDNIDLVELDGDVTALYDSLLHYDNQDEHFNNLEEKKRG